MKRLIFAVRDRASDTFGNPMFVPSRGQAIRSFADEVNRVSSENILSQHPEDFDLYELGFYDDDTALFDTHGPQQVAVGKDLAVGRS